MKNFRLIYLCCLIALVTGDVGETVASSDERELLCIFNITRRVINPEMETFMTNLRLKELKVLKNSHNRENFRRVCKRIQHKLIAFQIKMVQELTSCLRNETMVEYEAYVKITNKLTSYICNLDERRLAILGKVENYELIMSRGYRLMRCSSSSQNDFNFATDFCTVDETKLFECSLKVFDADNAEPRALLKMIWKFLNSLINCDVSPADNKTRIDAKYISNYFNNLLIPVVQSLLRDRNQRDRDVRSADRI